MRDQRAFGAVIDLDTATLYLRGELDVDTAPACDDALRLLLLADVPRLVVDISDLTFLGSAGLACLIRAASGHRTVALRNPQPQAQRLLEITRLDETFEVLVPGHAAAHVGSG